jgi:anti-anti-sigma factor
VVRLVGDLDLSAETELQALLLRLVREGGPATVVLDMSHVRVIDAHNIGLVMAAWGTAAAGGRQLRVAGLHGIPARLFDILGLRPLVEEAVGQGRERGGADGRRRGAGSGRGREQAVGGPHGPG